MSADQPFLVQQNGTPTPSGDADFTAYKLVNVKWEEAGSGSALRRLIDETLKIIDNEPDVSSVKVIDSDGIVRLLYGRNNG